MGQTLSAVPPSSGPKEKARYKLFFRLFAAFYLLIPLGLMAFNYTMDPYKSYHRIVPVGDLEKLAKSSEYVLALPTNHNDRMLLEDYIPLVARPSVVIMGGSRVMNIDGDVFGDRMAGKVLNAGVAEATVRDYIGIWQLLKEENKIPDAVYLCLEPHSFYSNDSSQGWYTLSRNVWRFQWEKRRSHFFKTCLQTLRREIRFYLETLSSSDTAQQSLKALREKQTGGKLMAKERVSPVYTTKTSSMTRSQRDNEQPESAIDEEGRTHGKGQVLILSRWGRREERAIDEVRSLVEDMRAHKVRVAIIMFPSHPLSYAYLEGHPGEHAVLMHIVEEMRALSVAKQTLFYDALYEHRGDVSNSDFNDGLHLKRQAANTFFKHAIDRAAIPRS